VRPVICLLFLMSAWAVRAEPPVGMDLTSPAHIWWECHKQPTSGISCCSEADGHVLDDHHWGTSKDGYWFVAEGQRHDVPMSKVLVGDTCGADPNEATRSEAKVWYRTVGGDSVVELIVLCFAPGTEY
jgi:hypothetical protein